MKGRKPITQYLPEFCVLFFCAALLCAGISRKEGYHQDEMLSFELANAEFNPWIVPTQPQGRLAKFVENELRGETLGETLGNLTDTVQDVLANRGNSKLLSYKADVYEEPVWISREQFRDYITVNGKDAFQYLSVYFNVKDDNHPPLYFMALHTVSSIFRGEVHPAMGCGINLVCVLGCMVLLMALGRQLMGLFGMGKQGRLAGGMAALLYGLSAGALSTTLLIRMYGMLTFFCVALLELHIRKLYGDRIREGSRGFSSHNKLLILVTVLGFLTQYFFLFYCLILAAVTAVALWRGKRRRELFCYVRSMALAALAGVGVFPFAISDVFSSGRGVEALQNLSAGFGGYGERLAAFGRILLENTCSPAVLGGTVMVLLASTLPWIAACKGKGEGRGCYSPWWVLLFPVAGYFLLASRMSPYLVDRYLMAIFPLVILMYVLAAFCLLGMAERVQEASGKGFPALRIVRGAVFLLMVLGQLCGLLSYHGTYLYSGYGGQKEVARQYGALPCICVYEGVSYYENLVEFTEYERTLLVTPRELADRKDSGSIGELEELVVILKSPQVEEQEVCALLEEKYGFTKKETLFRTRDYEDDIVLLFSREGTSPGHKED